MLGMEANPMVNGARVADTSLPDIVNGLVREALQLGLEDKEAQGCADMWLTTANVLGLSAVQVVTAASLLLASAAVQVRAAARGERRRS